MTDKKPVHQLEDIDLNGRHKTLVIHPKNDRAEIVTLNGNAYLPEKMILVKCSVCQQYHPLPHSMISDYPRDKYVFRDTQANLLKNDKNNPTKVYWTPSQEGFGLDIYCSEKCYTTEQL